MNGSSRVLYWMERSDRARPRGRKSLGFVGTTRGPLCGQAHLRAQRTELGQQLLLVVFRSKSRCPGR
jgi:hypothetical protein